MSAELDDLEAIDEIGPIVAETIVNFWNDEQNKTVVNACFNLGIKLEKLSFQARGILDGKSFVFTGSLESMTRNKAKNAIENLSGRVSGSVSKKTDFVVAGPGSGSKKKKAEKLGIKVLTEEEFLVMIT
jgi:DNA ligase (NAD+)